MTLALLSLALALNAQANSTFDHVVKEESVTFRLNANELQCDPGNKRGFIVPAVATMNVPFPIFDYGSNGQRFIQSNAQTASYTDEPGSCAKIAHLINQPNPNWRLADAKRVVKERYYRVTGGPCDKSMVEELTIKIQGEPDLEFTNTARFFVESVPAAQCQGNEDK